MSANIDAAGEVKQLDGRVEADEVVTEADVQVPLKLSKLLIRVLREIATLRRRWSPRRIDFEGVDLDATGTKRFRLPHKFNGRVRYWPVEWAGAAPYNIARDPATDVNTLVLVSTSAGIATIRVEEAG